MGEVELLNLMTRYFGMGPKYMPGEPVWKHRAVEAGKVRNWCFKNRVSAKDLCIAARYCHANGIPVTHWSELRVHIPEAVRWSHALKRKEAAERAAMELDSALAYERTFGSPRWVERLARTDPAHAEEVLEEWKNARWRK